MICVTEARVQSVCRWPPVLRMMQPSSDHETAVLRMSSFWAAGCVADNPAMGHLLPPPSYGRLSALQLYAESELPLAFPGWKVFPTPRVR